MKRFVESSEDSTESLEPSSVDSDSSSNLFDSDDKLDFTEEQEEELAEASHFRSKFANFVVMNKFRSYENVHAVADWYRSTNSYGTEGWLVDGCVMVRQRLRDTGYSETFINTEIDSYKVDLIIPLMFTYWKLKCEPGRFNQWYRALLTRQSSGNIDDAANWDGDIEELFISQEFKDSLKDIRRSVGLDYTYNGQ